MNKSLSTLTPKIRFSEFKGEWVLTPLNKVMTPKKLKNSNRLYGVDKVLSVTQSLGMVNQIDYLGRSYAGKDLVGYGVVNVGDVVYTKSPLKTAPYGIIKSNKYQDGIVSTLYATYSLKDGYSSDFIDRYFELTDHLNKYLRPLVHKGAKNDMKISSERVLIDSIVLPSLKEQNKISTLLSRLDLKISLLNEKYTALQKYKKGVIQKLFSQDIRFKNEDGNDFPDWEKGTLGDLSDKVSIKNKDESVINVFTNSAKLGIISQTDYFNKDIANQSNLGGYSIVEKDDFVYNPRISKLAPVGPIKRNHIGQGVMSPLYTIFRFKDESVLDYIELYFETTQWHRYMNSIANFGARHDRMNITMGDFFTLPIPIPSEDEMEKIVGFVQLLNKKIALVAQQSEQTQTFKKGLLQQMFV